MLAPLSQFQRNEYSQFGEDGILEEILRRVGSSSQLDGWCVEFGAWDGIHLSNTCNLIRNKKYKAVLIEGDKKKYEELCSNLPSDDIIKVCQFVTFSGDSTLDRILQRTAIPSAFDFLSVDIDGCDYFILESLVSYRPKVICIEFNPTVPNEVEFVQAKDFSTKQGASAKSLTLLAESKGYSLVAVTTSNLFFVQKQFQECVVGVDPISLDSLRNDAPFKSYLFCGYDGTVFTSRPLALLWHGLQINSDALQQIPRFLRKIPADFTLLDKVAFTVFVTLRFPKQFFGRAKNKER